MPWKWAPAKGWIWKKNIFETTALKKIEQIKNLHMSHTTHHSVLLSSQGSNVKKALKKRHWPKTGKTSLINNNDVGTRSENQTVGPGQRPFLSRFADAADILSIAEILQLLGCRQPTKTFKSHVIHRKKSWHEHGQATCRLVQDFYHEQWLATEHTGAYIHVNTASLCMYLEKYRIVHI